MDSPWRTTLTMEEFLEELAFADRKLEFFDGKVVDFAGGSLAHGDLSARLIGHFLAARRDGCRVFTSDVAVSIGDAAYVFPDLSYSCEPFVGTAAALVAPLVVVEVISPHSSRRDRVEKVAAYGRLASLREYLLVDSLDRNVTLFTRAGSGALLQQNFTTSADIVALASLDVRFSLDELYRGILA